MYPEHEVRGSDSPTGASAAPSGPTDAAFLSETLADALGHRRRRLLLRCLDASEFMVSRSDVAAQLAARESDAELADVSSEHREAIETTLHHAHVPKLADADLVEYDARSEMLALTPKAESIIPVL